MDGNLEAGGGLGGSRLLGQTQVRSSFDRYLEGRSVHLHHQRKVGMTRTDVVASTPQTAGAAPMRRGSSSALRRLLVLPAALSLAVALVVATTALAANTTTGYNQTPPPTTTGYNQTPSPSAGTSPSKEESATGTTTTPAKSAKASTLPFTGFDLRWTVGIGLLLTGMGFSIVTVQRRQRRSTGRCSES